jgi:CP family cyanate transporter-like MFS transporter
LALAVWSVPAFLAAAAWLPVARRHGIREPTAAGAGLPWRSGTAWLVAVFSGATFSLFWSVLTWLAPAFESQGIDAEHAGLLLTLTTVVQVVGSLAISALAGRSPDRRPWLILCLVVGAIGFTGIALFPAAAAAWVWTVLIEFGIGAIFPLSLSLPLDFAPDPASVSRLAAMAFSVGYLLAALGPFLMGWLRAASGGYAAPFLALAVLCCAMLLIAPRLRPMRPRLAR